MARLFKEKIAIYMACCRKLGHFFKLSLQNIDWFRCYHTRCDNRHRILSRWFQLDYWFFELTKQTQRYINFEYRKINNHCFSLKSIFYFFLPFENNIIKSINYEIIQNNKLRINNEVSWNLTVQNWTVFINLYRSLYRYRVRVPIYTKYTWSVTGLMTNTKLLA